jgi:ferrous iron transport protein A
VLRVEGHDHAAERLVALGFTPGTEVRYERRAPFGGPIVALVRGAMICLRPQEARRVVVEAVA